jgi:hypothetical protein
MENNDRFGMWLKDSVENWDIQYRIHATKRMFERDFNESDILECINNGTIIETYSNDFPFPSILLNGKTNTARPIHIVIGIDIIEKRLYIITIYEPDLKKWGNDYQLRIKK